MLMHGSGLTHIVWSLHEQFYASQGYNVLSIDLPGHGSSEGPSLKSIEDMSSWVKSFMETLKIQKIIIVGHSQGCLVGIDFASKYPEFIDGLVLVAGSYKMPVNQDLIDLAEAGDDKAILLMMKWGYEGSKAFIGGNPVKKIINSSREIIEILSVDLNACNNYKSGKESLEKINCPCCYKNSFKIIKNSNYRNIDNLEKQIKDLSGQINFQDSNKTVYIKKLENYLNTLKNKSILSSDSNNQITVDEINGVNYITQVIEGLPPKELRSVYDKFKSEKQNSILACITINEDKVSIIIGLTKDLIDKYDARILIKSSFDHLGSKGGGGRVDFAQAGGDQKSNINQAFSSIREQI